MSIGLLNRAFEARCQSGAEKAVLLALADRADDDGKCWPAIADLVLRASVGDRGTRKILERLSAARHITIHRHLGQRHRYDIHPVTPVPRTAVPRTAVLRSHWNPVPDPPEPSTGVPRNPVPDTPEPSTDKPPLTTIEPPLNHQGGGGGGDLFGAGEPKPKPRRKPDAEPPLDPIPSVLDLPAFREVWTEWMASRRHMKKPGSWNGMFNRQLKLLARTPDDAVEMVAQTLRGGWQGIFPLRAAPNNYNKPLSVEAQRNAMMAPDHAPVVGPYDPVKPKTS